MQSLLPSLTQTLQQAHSLETLARPLLRLLEQVTQLESAYLTTVDVTQDVQHVLYSHNTAYMHIPEGLSMTWQETLCQRALQAGCHFTQDVSGCWGDASAARVLGICSHASMPIWLADGSMYGTLCAASASQVTWPEGAQMVLQLFAHLIAQQMEREKLAQQLHERNEQLAMLALTDGLTQLPNRLALAGELGRILARAQRERSKVWLALIDLDGFKGVNDTYGHSVGDRLLCAVAQRLQATLRGGDLVARVGGDEFVMVTPASLTESDSQRRAAIEALQYRLHQALQCEVLLDSGHTLHYPGASVGWVELPGHIGVDEALQLADSAMYARKKQRRSSAVQASRLVH